MNELGLLRKLSRYQQELEERGLPVLPRSTPVLRYGRPVTGGVVTVGMNPSKAEFFDRKGNPLTGHKQKFYVRDQEEPLGEFYKNSGALNGTIGYFDRYFDGRASRAWFGKQGGGKLEGFLNGFGTSFYEEHPAVHLDAFPLATSVQMSRIKEKTALLEDEIVSFYRNEMIASLTPSFLLLLGREIGPLFSEQVEKWGEPQFINGFPDASFQVGNHALFGTVIWLHFKPSEQFIGLGNGHDAYGIHHGTYGSAESLRKMGAEVKMAVQGVNNDS